MLLLTLSIFLYFKPELNVCYDLCLPKQWQMLSIRTKVNVVIRSKGLKNFNNRATSPYHKGILCDLYGHTFYQNGLINEWASKNFAKISLCDLPWPVILHFMKK